MVVGVGVGCVEHLFDFFGDDGSESVGLFFPVFYVEQCIYWCLVAVE